MWLVGKSHVKCVHLPNIIVGSTGDVLPNHCGVDIQELTHMNYLTIIELA